MPSFDKAPEDVMEIASRVLNDKFPRLAKAEPTIVIEFLIGFELKRFKAEVPVITKLPSPEELINPGSPDVRVIVNYDLWPRIKSEDTREAIIAEGLFAIVPAWIDANYEVAYAKHSRPKITLKQPDVIISGFSEIAGWYGNRCLLKHSVDMAYTSLDQLVMKFMTDRGHALLDKMGELAERSRAVREDLAVTPPAPAPPPPDPGLPTAPDAGETLPDGGKPLRLTEEEQAIWDEPVIETDVETLLAAESDADDRRAKFEATRLWEVGLPTYQLQAIERQEVTNVGELETFLDDADFEAIQGVLKLDSISATVLLDVFYKFRNKFFGVGRDVPEWAGESVRCEECRVDGSFYFSDHEGPEWQCPKCFACLREVKAPVPDPAPFVPDYAEIEKASIFPVGEQVNHDERALDLMLGLALDCVPMETVLDLRRTGASDARIRDVLGSRWGVRGDHDTPMIRKGFSTRGGKIPAFWNGDDFASKRSGNGRFCKPDLQGPAPTARVRKCLRIPTVPQAAIAEPTKPKPAPEPVYDLFLVYGKRSQKTPVYSVRATSLVGALEWAKAQHPEGWKGRVVPDDGTAKRLKLPVMATVEPVPANWAGDDQADEPEASPLKAKPSENGRDIPIGMSACSRCNVIRPRSVVVCPQCGNLEFCINPDEPDPPKSAKCPGRKRLPAEPGEVCARRENAMS